MSPKRNQAAKRRRIAAAATNSEPVVPTPLSKDSAVRATRTRRMINRQAKWQWGELGVYMAAEGTQNSQESFMKPTARPCRSYTKRAGAMPYG